MPLHKNYPCELLVSFLLLLFFCVRMLWSVFLRSTKFYSVYNTPVFLPWKRCLAVVGNPAVDKALTTITGGRIDSWLQKYEELVGLREVKEAQHKVIEVISFQYIYYC